MTMNYQGDPLDLERHFVGFTEAATPRVVVDARVLDANIAAMQDRVGGAAALHPHIKTHKSIAIARRQIAAGASGITASRPNEAAVFIRAGIGPVTIAYPLVEPRQVAALLRLGAEHGIGLRLICDSEEGLDSLVMGSRMAGIPASVFLKVDVGLGRVGVDPQSQRAVALAERIAGCELELLGLISHAGQAYGADGRDGIEKIARQELAILHGFRDRLTAGGIAVPIISIGSTPTICAHAGFEGIAELRPGNYVFFDLTAIRLGIAHRSDLSLAVAATVIACNDTHAIIDAGSKTLSSDLGPHGTRAGKGYGEAWVVGRDAPLPVDRLSEEHGFVAHAGMRLAIGSKLLVLPNHACPVANLAASLLLLGDRMTEEVRVDARNGELHL